QLQHTLSLIYHFILHHIHSPSLLFTTPATTEIYTLSLHDALPISRSIQTSRRPSHTSSCSASIARSCPTSASARRSRIAAKSTRDRKSTRLNSSHVAISYAVFCLKKKNQTNSSLIVSRMFERKTRE